MKNFKAYQVLQLMRPIFHEEKQLAYHAHKEKLVQRQLHVKPLMDKFYAYLENINFPQGRLRAAINNALKLKTRVHRIFEDGRVPLTNNPVEQAIRLSTLIRKNSLFVKSTVGAQANAIFYTLVVTANQNHLNISPFVKLS